MGGGLEQCSVGAYGMEGMINTAVALTQSGREHFALSLQQDGLLPEKAVMPHLRVSRVTLQ